MDKIGIFSCAGVGDCLLILILAENLRKQGNQVTVFHPFMSEMQAWFPHVTIQPFPPEYEKFDRFIVVYEKSEWMKAVLNHCLTSYREKTVVLNPIATPNCDYPYWEEGKFNGNLTFADNLVLFCKNILGIQDATKENGLVIPYNVKPLENQVVIHPTSSRPGKNWPKAKFLKFANAIAKQGYNPIFVVSPKEKAEWPEAPSFKNLDEMARCVAVSRLMVGNDSGIGHLASCLGIPTLSLFKNERGANFWRPSFAPNIALIPKGWLPNLKGMRLRDTHWHWGISVSRVLRAFDELCELGNQTVDCISLPK